MPSEPRSPHAHYIHRLSYTNQERLVGAFVLIGLAILLTLLAVSDETGGLFEEKVNLHAYMKKAQGISPDTRVRVSGIEVGRVSSIDITPDNRIRVNMWVAKRFHNLIRQDSRAVVNKLSVFGLASIDITAGSISVPRLADGAAIPVEEAPSVDDLIADVAPVLDQLRQTIGQVNAVTKAVDPADVRKISGNLVRSSEHLAGVTGRVAAGEGALGALVSDPAVQRNLVDSVASLARALRATERRLDELQGAIASITRAGAGAGAVIDGIPDLLAQTSRVVAGVGHAVDAAEVRRVSAGLARASQNLAQITGQVKAGRGAVGAALFDPEFERRVVDSVAVLDRTLRAAEQRAKELKPVVSAAGEVAAGARGAVQQIPDLLSQTARLVAQLDATARVLTREMNESPDLLLRTREVLEQVDRTLGAVQNTWPLSSSVVPQPPVKALPVRPPND